MPYRTISVIAGVFLGLQALAGCANHDVDPVKLLQTSYLVDGCLEDTAYNPAAQDAKLKKFIEDGDTFVRVTPNGDPAAALEFQYDPRFNGSETAYFTVRAADPASLVPTGAIQKSCGDSLIVK